MIAGLTGLIGLAASRVLFWDFPSLKARRTTADAGDVSIIIPARNEALTLPYLLEDLKKQTAQPHEVICVDDDSSPPLWARVSFPLRQGRRDGSESLGRARLARAHQGESIFCFWMRTFGLRLTRCQR